MFSNDYDFEQISARSCIICQYVHQETQCTLPSTTTIPQKIMNTCSKYLHSAIIENNTMALSSETENIICPPCFESALRLNELDSQLAILQKSINDFLLTFSLTILHRRTKTKDRSSSHGTVEIDICKFFDGNLFNQPYFSEAEVDPLLINTEVEKCDDIINNEDLTVEEPVIKSEPVYLEGWEASESRKHADTFAFEGTKLNKTSGCKIKRKSNSRAVRVKSERELVQRGVAQATEKQGNGQSVGSPRITDTNLSDHEPEEIPKDCSDDSSGDLDFFPTASKRRKSTVKRSCAQSHRVPPQKIKKEFKCSLCPKSFGTKQQIHLHNQVHTGEKPFECPTCSAAFRTKYSMTNHMLIHSGEKPHKCSFCTTSFASVSNLRVHTRIHTGEKPYVCSFCAKAFSDKKNLAKHERTHTREKPFQCSVCLRAFITKTTLTNHMRIHTGEKPYNCSYCTKSYPRKAELIKHSAIHTDK